MLDISNSEQASLISKAEEYSGPLISLEDVRKFVGDEGDIESGEGEAVERRKCLRTTLFLIVERKGTRIKLLGLEEDSRIQMVSSAYYCAERISGEWRNEFLKKYYEERKL